MERLNCKMAQTVLLRDLLEISKNSTNPAKEPETKFNVYSIPGYDKAQPERLLGADIRSNKFVVNSKSILVSKLNPRIPRIWRVAEALPNAISSTEFVVLKVKPHYENLFDFLYAVMSSDDFSKFLQSRVKGTSGSHQRIKPEDIYEYPVTIDDSQSIYTGEFIRAIDEKIELNRKMNETLEQMGQALFRHYFIDNPEAENWEKGSLGQLMDINKESVGKGYSYDEIQYVDISSVSIGSIDKFETVKLSSAPSRAKRIVRDGDIIWATVRPNRRAYSLVMNPADNMVVSTGFAVLSPKKNALGFVYYHTSSQPFTDYLALHARGAAYPAVTASDFKNAPIAIPDTDTMKEFNELVLPNMRLMSELKEQIQTLTTLRDTLLPRLISGKVRV